MGRSDDPVNQALDDLTNDLQDQLDKSYHETEQAQRATARVFIYNIFSTYLTCAIFKLRCKIVGRTGHCNIETTA